MHTQLMHNETVDAHNAKVAKSLDAKKTIKEPNAPASEKQVDFLKKLLGDREINGQLAAHAQAELASGMSKGRAHEIIEWLLTQPKATKKEEPVVSVYTGPGLYAGGSGIIYVVIRKTTKYGNYDQFRKVYAVEGVKPKLVKCGISYAKTDINKGGHKMTLAEADTWGKSHQFNGASFCLCCGRFLTAKESVDYGVGPVCRKYWSISDPLI